MASPDKEALLDSVQVLSETRTSAESRVRLVRSLVEDGEVDLAELRDLQVTYSDARAAINAGLDRVLMDLETGGSARSEDEFRALAANTALHWESFLKESTDLIEGASKSGAIEAAVGAAESLISALVDVWKTLRGEKKERREAMIRRLESLKWVAFEAID